MSVYNNIAELVGNTPMLKLNKIEGADNANIFAKLEYFNPTSSVKDRIAVNMIDVAEKNGSLKPGGTIVEPTSGNTGLGLAMVAAARGYKLIITMPKSMSLERRAILKHLGAELVLTPPELGMNGAINEARHICETNDYFMPQQFDNPANPAIHKVTTAVEILEDVPNVDIFIAGVGTGGTLTGVGTLLKEKKPNVKIIAIEPSDSPILSGGSPGPHSIQGIGAGFIPAVLDTNIIDEVITITNEESFSGAKEIAAKEGVFCGISSGAAIAAAKKIALREENKGKNIVIILPDTGERYISTPLFS